MSTYIRYPQSGSGSGVATYATFADFPASAPDGTLALALDTDTLYAYNAGDAVWKPIAAPSSVLSIGTIDSVSPSANGAVIDGNDIIMQSASATVPGLVNTSAQTLAGAKTFSSAIKSPGIDVVATGGTDTLSIGVSNADIINIGNSGATVNIQGTTLYENVTQLQVTDPLITINKGGGAGSGANSGIEIEEAGSITSYFETSSDRNSWEMKAPNTAGVAIVTPGASGITLNQSSHNPVTIGTANGLSLATQVLSLALSSGSTTGALSSTDWNTFNGKQAAGNYITALTGDGTASGPGSVALTLATVNGNVGSFTLANLTVNGKGLITAASSTAVGNLTDVGTDGIVVTGGTGAVIGSGTSIAQHVADSTHNGYLSSTDWSTFNGKQAAGNYITALSGDATASGPGSAALTLATVNSNVGSFTYASITVNAKGLITAASNGTTPGTVSSVALSVPATSIFGVTGSPVTTTGTLGLTTTGTSGGIPYFSSTSQLASSALLTANALVLGGGAGAAPVALGSLGTTSTVLHGNAAGAPTFGAVSLTADVSGTLPNTSGGTGQNSAWNANGIVYASSATVLASTTVGNAGQVLTSNGTGVAPTFQTNGSAITANYAALYTNTATFSTSSNTFADPANSGTPGVTSRISNGLTVTQAGSNLAGITLTPSSATAVYEVTATFQCRNASANENFAVRLFDGTNEVAALGAQNPTSVTVFPITLYGLWAPGTTSASTIKVQGRTSAGTMTIQAIATTGSVVIDWTITQIRA